MNIRGLIPATVTPFREDGSIDYEDLERHVATVASAEGVFGIAVNGHAGEILALSAEERAKIVSAARKALPSRIKLIAGIEAHDPAMLVKDGVAAREAGADGLLVLPPFDIRPYRRLAQDPDAVFAVFSRLDREVGLPMIVFQYPDSSGCAYSTAALVRIAELRNVVGVKVSTPEVSRYVEIYEALKGRVAVLPANDAPPLLGNLLHGADGALIGISVVGTSHWSELVKEATEGSAQRAKEIFHHVCIPLMAALFENQQPKTLVNPFAATKEALMQLGQLRCAQVRPPLVKPDGARKAVIRQALVDGGLLKTSA
jgi:4-hydroxy-tetrahydrodipicolinate synthase